MNKGNNDEFTNKRLLTPWSRPQEAGIQFSIKSLEILLAELGWPLSEKWVDNWSKRGGVELARSKWPSGIKLDWIWGVGLPLMTDIERFLEDKNERYLFGISGLPGCGKTSLGKWIESAALELNFPISVISLDDFYFPYQKLKQVMDGNPWNVPRAIPGSHDIDLMQRTISTWKETGKLIAPQFDKALRSGRGDRSGWRESKPNVLVIEGWFLSCKPLTSLRVNSDDSNRLTPLEISYRLKIQEELSKYKDVWEYFDRLWHLKALKFSSTDKWKKEQEANMQQERGSSLKGTELNSFLRMINTAIPQSCLEELKADVIAKINDERTVKWIGRREDE